MSGAYSPWQMMNPNVAADVNAWKPVINMPPPGAMLAAVPPSRTAPPPVPDMPPAQPQGGYGPVKNPMENVAPEAAPESYEQLLQALKARGDQMAEEQRRSADFQRQTLPHVVKGDLQYDLSPLAALVDQWSGSNLARAYKAPETGQQRQAQIAGLRKGVTDADQQASATEMAALKALADGTFGLQKFAADEKYKEDMLEIQRDQNDISRGKIARGEGGKILPATVIQNYTENLGAVDMAGDLKSVIAKNARLMGPVEGLKAKNPYSTSHRELVAQFDGIRQRIGKMIEGGVLRKEDESKYKKILPNIEDLPEVARAKSIRLEAELKRDLGRYMSNFGKAGYDVSGFSDQTQAFVEDAKKVMNTDDQPNEWGLTVGQESDGMKYKGGNPKDPTSWE